MSTLNSSFSLRFGSTWKPYIVRVAYSKLKDVTTSFPSNAFFETRSAIQSAMFTKLSATLSAVTNGALELMNLQLRKVALEPTVYKNDMIVFSMKKQSKLNLLKNKTTILY